MLIALGGFGPGDWLDGVCIIALGGFGLGDWLDGVCFIDRVVWLGLFLTGLGCSGHYWCFRFGWLSPLRGALGTLVAFAYGVP